MKNLSKALLSSTLIAGCFALSHPLRAETLQDAVLKAVQGHPSVRAASQARDASQETVREQRSAYFPELAANAQAGRIYADNSTSRGLSVTRGAGYSNLWEGNASMTQRVFDWGETNNKVDAAKARMNAAVSVLSGAEESVALQTTQAFIALLRATELKTQAAQELKILKEYQNKIAIQVKEGGADDAELNRANDFLLLATNAMTEFTGQYEQALADYVQAVGEIPQSPLKRPALPGLFPSSLDDAIDQAFVSHPQVQAAKDAVIATDHDMRVEKTSYLPKLSGQLSYLEREQRDVIGGEATDARAVMKMDWAYSTGGAQHARVDRATHLREQAKAELDETYRVIERDIRVAWSALDVVRQQEKTQTDRLAATTKVVDTYKTQYDGGKRSLIELMQAESQAFDARVAYASADYGILGATYTLMAAMGQLQRAVQPQPMAEDVAQR